MVKKTNFKKQISKKVLISLVSCAFFLLMFLFLFSQTSYAACYFGQYPQEDICVYLNPASCNDTTEMSNCTGAAYTPTIDSCKYEFIDPLFSVCSVYTGSCGATLTLDRTTCKSRAGQYLLRTTYSSGATVDTTIYSTAFVRYSSCGDGVCDLGEDCSTCPVDCSVTAGRCCIYGAEVYEGNHFGDKKCVNGVAVPCTVSDNCNLSYNINARWINVSTFYNNNTGCENGTTCLCNASNVCQYCAGYCGNYSGSYEIKPTKSLGCSCAASSECTSGCCNSSFVCSNSCDDQGSSYNYNTYLTDYVGSLNVTLPIPNNYSYNYYLNESLVEGKWCGYNKVTFKFCANGSTASYRYYIYFGLNPLGVPSIMIRSSGCANYSTTLNDVTNAAYYFKVYSIDELNRSSTTTTFNYNYDPVSPTMNWIMPPTPANLSTQHINFTVQTLEVEDTATNSAGLNSTCEYLIFPSGKKGTRICNESFDIGVSPLNYSSSTHCFRENCTITLISKDNCGAPSLLSRFYATVSTSTLLNITVFNRTQVGMSDAFIKILDIDNNLVELANGTTDVDGIALINLTTQARWTYMNVSIIIQKEGSVVFTDERYPIVWDRHYLYNATAHTLYECMADCTKFGDVNNLCNGDCEGINGCAFNSSEVKDACTAPPQVRGARKVLRTYADSEDVTYCCGTDPVVNELTTNSLTVQCIGGTIVKLTKIVLVDGEPLKMNVVACSRS